MGCVNKIGTLLCMAVALLPRISIAEEEEESVAPQTRRVAISAIICHSDLRLRALSPGLRRTKGYLKYGGLINYGNYSFLSEQHAAWQERKDLMQRRLKELRMRPISCSDRLIKTLVWCLIRAADNEVIEPKCQTASTWRYMVVAADEPLDAPDMPESDPTTSP